MKAMPKWATSERLAVLEKIGADHTCALGEENCPVIRELSDAIAKRIGPAHAAENKLLWASRAAVIIAKLTTLAVVSFREVVTYRQETETVHGPLGDWTKTRLVPVKVRVPRREPLWPYWKQAHLPDALKGELIATWQASDREETAMLRDEAKRAVTSPDMTGWLQLIKIPLPGTPETIDPWERPHRHLDPVERDISYSQQPLFTVAREGVGWDVKSQKPVKIVEVRVPSSLQSLMVEVALSKPQFNRRQRRQRERARWIQRPEVVAQCEDAVRDYKSR